MASISFILQTIIFVLLELVGISTNTITLYLLLMKWRKSLKMSPVTRVLLLNLTIIDLLAMATLYPIMFITVQCKSWYFGWFACKLFSFDQMTSLTVITYTLTAIALQWYNSPIMKPHKEPVSLKQCYSMLSVIWIMAVVLSIPMLTYQLITTRENVTPLEEIPKDNEMLITNVTENDYFANDSIVDFNLTFESSENFTIPTTVDVQLCVQIVNPLVIIYSLQMFVVTHVVPFLICAFTYTRIACRIWCCKTAENLNQNDLKTSKMMLITTAAFMLLNVPFNVLNTSQHFVASEMRHVSVVFIILADVNVFYKPLIYICVNDNFRNAFRRVLSGKEFESRDGNENDQVDQLDQSTIHE